MSCKKKRVVITHHAPLINPVTKYTDSQLTYAFNSIDMMEIIDEYQPALWVYGHTHECDDHFRGRTRIISNQRGNKHHKLKYECQGDFDPEGKLVNI